jgi:iduronate 2-sulfatase
MCWAYGKVARGMGHSMRTDRYRFTEWIVPATEFRAYELYDHHTDPDENANQALAPEYQQLVIELKKQLQAGWKSALP